MKTKVIELKNSSREISPEKISPTPVVEYPKRISEAKAIAFTGDITSLDDLFDEAEWPIYVSGYWEPIIKTHSRKNTEHMIFRERGKEKIYIINTDGMSDDPEKRAKRIIEILTTQYFDYLCTESVCEKGYFYPELFGQKLIDIQKKLK